MPPAGLPVLAAGCIVRRRLPAHPLGERFAAVESASGAPVLLYRLGGGRDGATQAVARRIERLSAITHPHILRLRRMEMEPEGRLWIVADYPGTHAGVLSLAGLLSQKEGGRVAPQEARHAVMQILSALAAGQRAGLAHGSLRSDDVIVDPRGRALIELPGVERALTDCPPPQDAAEKADLSAAAGIAYELLTGVSLPPTDEARTGHGGWDAWIRAAARGEWSKAGEALAHVPRR